MTRRVDRLVDLRQQRNRHQDDDTGTSAIRSSVRGTSGSVMRFPPLMQSRAARRPVGRQWSPRLHRVPRGEIPRRLDDIEHFDAVVIEARAGTARLHPDKSEAQAFTKINLNIQ